MRILTKTMLAAALVVGAASPSLAIPPDILATVDRNIEELNNFMKYQNVDAVFSRKGEVIVVSSQTQAPMSEKLRIAYKNDPTKAREMVRKIYVEQLCSNDFAVLLNLGFSYVVKMYDSKGLIGETQIKPGDCR